MISAFFFRQRTFRVNCFDTQTKTVASGTKSREHGTVERRRVIFQAEPVDGATSSYSTNTNVSTSYPMVPDLVPMRELVLQAQQDFSTQSTASPSSL